METTTEAVMLRVLVLMTEADREFALQEQQMLQSICNEHLRKRSGFLARRLEQPEGPQERCDRHSPARTLTHAQAGLHADFSLRRRARFSD